MTPENQPNLNKEYLARINRVIDAIESNLDGDLNLETLAEVANFSPFHFHRIFHALMGETLNQFIKRQRIEKAAVQLVYNPKKSVTDIALDCGFSSSATFARAFKESYGMSGSVWREGGYKAYSKNRKLERKNRQMESKLSKASVAPAFYSNEERRHDMTTQSVTDTVQAKVEVQDLPEKNVAYIRFIGAYQGKGEVFAELFQKLARWAGPRGLFSEDSQTISVYHDDPEITDENKLRLEACLTVPEGTPVEGEIGSMTIAGGRYAVAHFELDADQYGEAWQYIYGTWLPESGYMPDDRPSLEVYLNSPEEHPEHKHLVDICVPVRPL